MKVTLITVCLNSESTIADTVESVLQQSYKSVEHIIFDGGSTDRTLEILKAYGNQIMLIEGKDSSIFNAMNQAIGHASGEVVGIINSDDFYAHPQVLENVVDLFKAKGTDSVYGDLHYVYKNNPGKVFRNWRSGHFERSKFKYGWTLPHPTFFVKRHVYDRYGLFDDSFEISADYGLVIKFLYKHQITTAYLPQVLVKMRTGGNSDGGFIRRMRGLMEDYRAWRANGLSVPFYTVPLKPLRKIPQLIFTKTIL